MPSSVQSPVSSPCDGPYNGLQIRGRLSVPSSVPSLFRPTRTERSGIPNSRSPLMTRLVMKHLNTYKNLTKRRFIAKIKTLAIRRLY